MNISATMQKAARKLNFPFTKLIIERQHLWLRQPYYSGTLCDTNFPAFASQMVAMSYLGQLRSPISTALCKYLFVQPKF